MCEDVWLRVETSQTCVTRGLTPGETLQIPVKHGEGQWVATAEQLGRVEDDGLVVFRYSAEDGQLGDARTRTARRTTSRACATRPATWSG